MTKRPDQHNLDPSETLSTDYKFRRKSEDGVDREGPEDLPANRETTQTPNEAMEARRRQSQRDREAELERARSVRDRKEQEEGEGEGEEQEEG